MNPPPTLTVDLLVAGAGIAGLHVATRYLRSNGSHSVLLVERNSYLGGRVYTHHQTINKTEYQWEAGAGRIPISHKRIIGLIKEYGLTFQKWSAPPNLNDPFPDLIPAYLEPLQALPVSVLAENTLADLLRQIHGPAEANRFMALFPYWAEFHTLRADLALDAFLRGPLGGQGGKAGHGPAGRSTAGAGWGGCAEGLSALVERMGADIEARGGVIQKGVSVLEVRPLGRAQGFAVLVLSSEGKREWIQAKKVVMALDAGSLRKVKGVAEHVSALRWLKSEPLLRTYAVFPVLVPPSKPALLERSSRVPHKAPNPQGGDESSVHNGKSWFSGMAKEVVPGPIRFFIPMDHTKGLAMISYTEGRDARYWLNMPVKKREHAVMKALRELYPDKEIPDPLFVKFHGWESGCTYWTPARGATATVKEHWVPARGATATKKENWTPGRYDAVEESEKSVQPLGGLPLYVCSESFSIQQSWMESGLEQAERVLTKLLRP